MPPTYLTPKCIERTTFACSEELMQSVVAEHYFFSSDPRAESHVYLEMARRFTLDDTRVCFARALATIDLSSLLKMQLGDIDFEEMSESWEAIYYASLIATVALNHDAWAFLLKDIVATQSLQPDNAVIAG